MSFPSGAVASRFLRLAAQEGKPITPMQLQKLVYFAHGWYCGITGERLVHEDIEAWEFGPVIRNLYRKYKKFGSDPIEEQDHEDKRIGENTFPSSLIESIWRKYRDFDGPQLSSLTHKSGPWKATREANPGSRCAVIKTGLIVSHFRDKVHGTSS